MVLVSTGRPLIAHQLLRLHHCFGASAKLMQLLGIKHSCERWCTCSPTALKLDHKSFPVCRHPCLSLAGAGPCQGFG